jgi:hypothetical protein
MDWVNQRKQKGSRETARVCRPDNGIEALVHKHGQTSKLYSLTNQVQGEINGKRVNQQGWLDDSLTEFKKSAQMHAQDIVACLSGATNPL